MEIQDVKLRRITVKENETILTERLGKGAFCEAYKDTASEDVYLFMNENNWCPGKEILRQCDKSCFIPDMMYFGSTETRSRSRIATYEIWKTTYSKSLKAQHKQAWSQYKTLEKAWVQCILEIRKRNPVQYSRNYPKYAYGDIPFYAMTEIFTDLLRLWGTDTGLVDSLEDICNITLNYGDSIWLEFYPKNLGVTADGQLILRDIVVDRAKL